MQHRPKLFERRAPQLDCRHIFVWLFRAIPKYPLLNLECRNEENNDPGQTEHAAQQDPSQTRELAGQQNDWTPSNVLRCQVSNDSAQKFTDRSTNRPAFLQYV